MTTEGKRPPPPLDEAARTSRRDTFMHEAGDYAAARPEYPEEALADAVAEAGLRPGDAVLEVGCGTGQATAWLAAHGYRVVAVDRSEPMIALARERLRDVDGVEVRLADFEKMEVDVRYAALVFATSFHWLDPADRAGRCARHLKPGGGLVLLWHTHPPPFTGFFERSQPIYRRFMKGWEPPPSPGMVEERIGRICDELEEAGFDTAARRSYDWSRTYARDAYLALMRTYSDHALLAEEPRAALFTEVAALIDDEFDGRVTRPYRTVTVVARSPDR